MAKKPKYTAEGKDYSGGKFVDATLEINLPGPPSNPGPVRAAGTPVSRAAFTELQNQYNANKKPSDTVSVTFSREAILTILAQNDCAGIKFYFVNRADTTTNQLTLTMAGVDVNNNDLNTVDTTSATSEATLLTEWGGGYPPSI